MPKYIWHIPGSSKYISAPKSIFHIYMYIFLWGIYFYVYLAFLFNDWWISMWLQLVSGDFISVCVLQIPSCNSNVWNSSKRWKSFSWTGQNVSETWLPSFSITDYVYLSLFLLPPWVYYWQGTLGASLKEMVWNDQKERELGKTEKHRELADCRFFFFFFVLLSIHWGWGRRRMMIHLIEAGESTSRCNCSLRQRRRRRRRRRRRAPRRFILRILKKEKPAAPSYSFYISRLARSLPISITTCCGFDKFNVFFYHLPSILWSLWWATVRNPLLVVERIFSRFFSCRFFYTLLLCLWVIRACNLTL